MRTAPRQRDVSPTDRPISPDGRLPTTTYPRLKVSGLRLSRRVAVLSATPDVAKLAPLAVVMGHAELMEQFRRGGLVFDVRDSGPADGPVVVLLHGAPQSNSSWDAVVSPALPHAGIGAWLQTNAATRPAPGRRVAETIDCPNSWTT